MLQNVMFLKKKWNYYETIHDGGIGQKETIYYGAIGKKSLFIGHRFLKHAKNRGRDWSFRNNAITCEFPHGLSVRLSLKSVRLIRAENKRMQLCLQIELGEENSQLLYSQKSPRWAQWMFLTKVKDRYLKCSKNVLYAGPKSARNILKNLSPNPARPEKPGPT